MPRDSRAMTDLVEEFDPLTDDQIFAMQRVIAANAKGRSKKARVEDATALMMMLGVHPDQAGEWKLIARMNQVGVSEMKAVL